MAQRQQEEESADEFFRRHGIRPDIWRSRPYIRWTTGDLTPIRQAYVGLKGIRDTLKKAQQQPGWIITGHAPPGLQLDHVYPEIRPDNPVRRSGVIKHYHGEPLPPPPKKSCPNHAEKFCTNCVSPWRIYSPRSKSMQDHIERDKDHDEHGDHGGVNSNQVHFHQRYAKYNFPSGPDLAKRFDMHTLAAPLFMKARYAFFVIEGSIKADAVLSAGAAVLSVPSVTLWDAKELYVVSERYLKGRLVIIVPDADWNRNDLVNTQARLCQSHLARLGILAHVVAPPINAWLEDHNLKAVDDHLAAGKTLGELEVIDRDPSPNIRRFVRDHTTRLDQMRRDIEAIETLSIHADDVGRLCPTVSAIARMMNTSRGRVADALDHLEEMGAIARERGEFETRRQWIPRKGGKGHYGHQLEWKKPPTITIIPELRATSRQFSLEDLLRDHHIEGGVSR